MYTFVMLANLNVHPFGIEMLYVTCTYEIGLCVCVIAPHSCQTFDFIVFFLPKR